MSKAMKATLLLIGVAMFAMVSSFIWFVATWDKSREVPVVFEPTPANSSVMEAT